MLLPLTAVLISQAFQFSHSLQWALYTNSFSFVFVYHSVSLFHFSVSLFPLPLSQLDSRDNNGVSVSFLQILFSNQLANKHSSPVLFHHLPFISVSASLVLPYKGSFPQTKSPVILNIPTFLSTFHLAWVVLIASFGLHGHPLACYCALRY